MAIYLAAVLASAYEEGTSLFILMERFCVQLEHPLSLRITPYTLRFVLIALACYGFGAVTYYSSRENRRPGEEYGSAVWGSPYQLNRKYATRRGANVILTRHVSIGMDGYIHKRNLNIVVIGGSGSGKSRSFCKPGVMDANCSYLITDPKGEMLRACGSLLQEEGYEVCVFDLAHPSCSDGYNPFHYIRDEQDVLKLIDNLIRNTTPRTAGNVDPFWEKAESALDSALMLYLMKEAPVGEQNFDTLLLMLEYAQVREEDEQYQSPVDMLFQELEEEEPEHPAVKQYKHFKLSAGKTAKSILVSSTSRFGALSLPQYARITRHDDMDFASLGERKRAIFCVLPVTDRSMNYLAGMLYTQCFQELYRLADERYNGRLPMPVRVIQDEWANIAQPDSYPQIVATCRSYNIGINIVVQNIQNIKALYKDDYDSIIGNCDTLLFLGGGNEPTSLEYISKLLGKETLSTRSHGQTKGRSGSSSTNDQKTGRDLMTPDEVRLLKDDEAVLLIRGERPVLDRKYDIMHHPNIARTADGGAKPYIHRGANEYALPDLPYAFHDLADYTFLEENDDENK